MDPSRWKQIEELYHAALESQPGERTSILAQADPELRREVESLLAQDTSKTGALDRPAWAGAVEFSGPASTVTLFTPGAQLGPYKIEGPLGKGGMGEVFRATDTRLHRTVAIKILPRDKVADPDRKKRFLLEARAASALNHPNIVTLHDIASDSGVDYLVMECVPGKSLDKLISWMGLPLAEALNYAQQIASGLAAAHAAGIVHRDMKPANVIVTPESQVKILDFGLAKLAERKPGAEGETQRQEATLTEAGTVMGTASYMSPEQAEGKTVDARSDIFSFGALLYEMLTGRRAFHGDSTMSTLAAILNREPEPVEKLTGGIPPELARLVQRCLRKQPDRRAHSMQDLKLALEEIKESSDSGSLTAASVVQLRSRAFMLPLALALVTILGGGAFWFWRGRAADPPLQAVPLTAYPGFELMPSFSPDGNQVAFSWNGDKGDNYDIYVQLIGSVKPLRLTTDPGRDSDPAWSPDGRSIAFVRADSNGSYTILQIPALGGVEREVAQFGAGASLRIGGWSPDGRWLLISMREAVGQPVGLFLVSAESGEKRRLTSPPPGTTGDVYGAIAPDGRTVVFIRGLGIGGLYAIPLKPDFSPAGDARRLTSDNAGLDAVAWTKDSNEIVFSFSSGGSTGLWRMAPSGSEQPRRVAVGENSSSIAISSRTNRLVYEQMIPGDVNIWRTDLSGSAAPPSSFIASTRLDESPQYSPDGKRIAFRSSRSGSDEIWVCDADGSNAVQLTSTGEAGSPYWSPDGRRVAFDSFIQGHFQSFVVASRGGQPQQMTFGLANNGRPAWSHDGQWIYFNSNRSGRFEVWKMPAGGGTGAQLSRNGGRNPLESEDGKTVYYTSGSTIAKAAVDGGGETKVVDQVSDEAKFALARDGIYYFAQPEYYGPTNYEGPTEHRDLWFFNFASGTSRVIAKSIALNGGFLSIAVSPDGHWLLYPREDGQAGSDLMLVENFR